MLGDKPALIDFDNSIIGRNALTSRDGSSYMDRSENLSSRVRGFLLGANLVADENGRALLAEIRKLSVAPTVLVIGGGERGAGTEPLYGAPDVTVIGTDVYGSNDVSVIADGHALPFADASFDAVWIQAVLEHVLEPTRVVSEIARVLKPGGIVYAETPFMQQVHEGPYDFTRFTRSGHRWLFRGFDEIRAGNVGGPGTSLIWSIRYLVRSLTRSNKLATGVALAFFWLRFMDRLADPAYASDAANGVFFLGRKNATPLAPRDMIAYYPGPRSVGP